MLEALDFAPYLFGICMLKVVLLSTCSCTIPRVSVKEWMQLAPSADNLDTPVVITGFFDNHMPGGFADICTRTELLKRYGSKNITLASANSHSYDKQTTTFEKYVREMIEPVTLESVAGNTYYLFGDNDYSDWTNFTQHYKYRTLGKKINACKPANTMLASASD